MADETHIHDILIIGAGPCGLALAARLCEPYPSALFTDSEHQKFHFLRRSQPSASSSSLSPPKHKPIRTSRRAHTSLDRLSPGPSNYNSKLDIAVLDKHSSSWLGVWNTWFDKLNIEYLRSPLFFHTDPGDRDALRAFAWRGERMDELKEIRGVVGRELSKWARRKRVKGKGSKGKQTQEHTYLDERDRNDYFRPSQALFRSHCEEVASRYNLSNMVEEAEVLSVSYDPDASIFTLQTSIGTRKARVVCMAAGAGAPPRLPPDSPFNCVPTHESAKHVFSSPSPTATILPEPLLRKVKQGNKETSLAVIGSGLTSAQICKLAAEKGVGKIYLVCRDRMKTKHFDVDLCWLAKFKNESMARFWMADGDQEKWEMVRDAKGGGSVNPEFRDVVRDLVAKGTVVLREESRVCDATWSEDEERWRLGVGSVKCAEGQSAREEIEVDAVVYATGSAVDFTAIRGIQPLLAAHPLRTVAGLPCLTKELMWNEDVPFFVTGRLGGLRLGPAAGNLEGARIGAELVAGRVLGLLGVGEERCVDERCIGLGMSNSFGVLGSDGEEEVRAML